jgi:site-specific DNA recombinase
MTAPKLRGAARRNKPSGHNRLPSAVLILAVAYYRMSSDKQDKSIDEQKTEVRKWAAANGYKIISEYEELGISGDDTAKRKAFQRMMQDAESGDFQAILSWDQDRFGRFDTVESGFWIHPLRQAGIHLATIAQGVIDWNSFSGRLIYNVQQEGKHQFLHDLSRNTTRGLVAKAQRGEWVSGPVPLGYKVVDKRLALSSQAETELVIRIFDLYDAAGLSIRGVRDAMQKRGRNPWGRLWSETIIREILSRPVYCGDFIWPKESTGKYTTAAQSLTEKIEIRDNHPAIISREQFDRVQRRLKESRGGRTPIKNGGDYLLSGLLYCKNCGRKMYGWRNSTNKNKAIYYRCNGHSQLGKAFCDINQISQNELLDEVLTAIESWASNPDTRAMVESEIAGLVEDATSGDSAQVLAARLASVDQKLARAEERILIVDDDLVTTIQNMVRELRNERREIESALKAARVPARSIRDAQTARADAAMEAANNLRGVIAASDPPRVRQMLRELIEKIEIRVIKKQPGKKLKYSLQSGEIRFINPIKLAPGWHELPADLEWEQ